MNARGNLIIVIPIIITLLAAGAFLFDRQRGGRTLVAVNASESEAKRIAYGVLQRTKAALRLPGPTGGGDNCGNPATAGTINARLLPFRNLAVPVANPVTLNYTAPNAGNLFNTCLLPASDTSLPLLNTVQVTVSQIGPPDIFALSAELEITVSVGTAAGGDGQLPRLRTLSERLTMRVARMGRYALVLYDPAGATPSIDLSGAANAMLRVDGLTYHQSGSGTTVALNDFISSADGKISFDRPVHFQGTAVVPPAAPFDLSAMGAVFRAGFRPGALNDQVTSYLPLPISSGTIAADNGPLGSAWNQRIHWNWMGPVTRMEPLLDMSPDLGVSTLPPGYASIPPVPAPNIYPSAAEPWINTLSQTCENTRPLPHLIFNRANEDIVLNMANGADAVLCSLITAKKVTINLAAGTDAYVFGPIFASQLVVTGGPGMLTIMNGFLGTENQVPLPGTQTITGLVDSYRSVANLWGRNWFAPVFRKMPGLLQRQARFRPSGGATVLVDSAFIGGPDKLLIPGYKFPCKTVPALDYAATAAPPYCGANYWQVSTTDYNLILGSPSVTGQRIAQDLFGAFSDNLVVTLGDEP